MAGMAVDRSDGPGALASRDAPQASTDADFDVDEQGLALAVELDRLVHAEPGLERHAPPRTGIYLWRPRGLDATEVRSRIRGAFVSLAHHGGSAWLRSVSANPMADPARVVAAVLEAAGTG